MYADDYQDYYPPSRNWMLAVGPYLDKPDRLHCPTVSQPGDSTFGYAMNSALGGALRSKVEEPGKMAAVFDSANVGRDASNELKSLPRPGRHRGRESRGQQIKPGNNIGYADGSVKFRFDSLPAMPKNR
jgi:prepilin-type processing-associated H-X9-DG protein